MYKKLIIILLTSIFFTGCSSNPTSNQAIYPEDKYENFNRKVHKFNMGFDSYVGQPIGKAYKTVTPQPVRTGVGNFFNNLKLPLNMVNNFLQGNGEEGLSDIMRFSINTVFGFGGFIDVATPAGLEYNKKDLGQTLYKWGVWESSHFLVLPIFGATTTRDSTGALGEYIADPTYNYLLDINQDKRNLMLVLNLFNTYAEYLDLIESLKDTPDPYVFLRETYIQHRNNTLYDGRPPLPDYDDFDFD